MEIEIYRIKINNDFLIEYREFKAYKQVNLIYKEQDIVCYIKENYISMLDKTIIKKLNKINNIIIKYIIKMDKLNKENKLNINDIKKTHDNLRYIIKENNKNE